MCMTGLEHRLPQLDNAHLPTGVLHHLGDAEEAPRSPQAVTLLPHLRPAHLPLQLRLQSAAAGARASHQHPHVQPGRVWHSAQEDSRAGIGCAGMRRQRVNRGRNISKIFGSQQDYT